MLDKFIVNLGNEKKLYVIKDLHINLSDNSVEFYSPLLINIQTGESSENDGFHLYANIVKSNRNIITTPYNLSSDNKVVISTIKFEVDAIKLILNFYFKIDKGFFDGSSTQILDLDEPGFYYLKYDLHKDLPWWEDFSLPEESFRVGSFYDVKFNIKNIEDIWR